MKPILIFIILLTPVLALTFGGGTGLPGDPYLVETPEHLNEIRYHLDAHFLQTVNIDLTDYLSPGGPGYNNGLGWDPLGSSQYGHDSFTGSYNGAGHTISNLYINRPFNLNTTQGLFGSVEGSASLLNIRLENVDVTGLYAGALAGSFFFADIISNCHSSGIVNGLIAGGVVGFMSGGIMEESSSEATVSSESFGRHGSVLEGVSADEGRVTGSRTGGLIGSANVTIVRESYATGSVVTTNIGGGLIGHAEQSNMNRSIINCYATGDVTGMSGNKIGALIGQMGWVWSVTHPQAVQKSYATGRVSHGLNSGGLIGFSYSAVDFPGCYWDMYSTGQISSVGGQSKITPEMMQHITYTNWDFDDIWQIDENSSYPYLRNNPPEINPAPQNLANDIGTLYLYGSQMVAVDSTYIHTVVVYNMGINPQNTFTIRLVKGADQELASLDVSELLYQYEQIEIPVPWIPASVFHTHIRAEVLLDGDEYPDNNRSVDFHLTSYAAFDEGTGTTTQPYQISSANQLYSMRFFLDDHFEQTANIDLDDFIDHDLWEPVGSYVSEEENTPFTGSFNGNDHIIANLPLVRNQEWGNYYALFGYTGEDSIIRNVIVENIVINSSSGFFAGIAGMNSGTIIDSGVIISHNPVITANLGGLVYQNEGLIENSFADLIFTTLNPELRIAGLVQLNRGVISDSQAVVDFTGGNNTGGLVGRNDNPGAIYNSSATGTIEGLNSTGGLAGQNYGFISGSFVNAMNVTGMNQTGGFAGSNFGQIETSCASGNVLGESHVGGMVGRNTGILSDSYSTNSVRGFRYVGGSIGSTSAASNVTHCYSTGRVFGVFDRGGLIGINNGSVVQSYWDVQTSNQASSSGGEGRTTAEMMQQATFVDWDFDEIWDIIENETYPFLYYQDEPLDVDDQESVIPRATELLGNYPNPFNPETTIRFYLANAEEAKVEIFNIKGQRVNKLLDIHLERGEHRVKWDGKDDRGSYVSSGIYFYRLITSKGVEQRKMLLLR